MVKLLITFLVLMTMVGCSPSHGFKKVSLEAGLETMLQDALDSDELSFKTKQYLIAADLEKVWLQNPDKVIELLSIDETQLSKIKILMELCYDRAKKTKKSRKNKLYLSCARYAYIYLDQSKFSPEIDLFINHAVEYYNTSLTCLLDQYHKQKIDLGDLTTNKVIGRYIYQAPTKSKISSKLSRIDNYYIASRYATIGMTEESRRTGLGVPIIAEQDPNTNQFDRIFYDDVILSYPATMILSFMAGPSNQYDKMQYAIYDSPALDRIKINQIEFPLARNISTAVAFMLEQNRQVVGLKALFDVAGNEKIEGIRLLSPFNPKKIPVIFVHGLMSAPPTWFNMLTRLICDEEINSHYQFWFYRYPSGNSVLLTASHLRASLEEVYRLYGTNKNHRLHDIVIVGHSMGGLVSKLTIKDSKDDLWRVEVDYPLNEIDLAEKDRQYLLKLFYFKPSPYIKRAIFIATPHRGSKKVDTWYGRIGSWMIKYSEDHSAKSKSIERSITHQKEEKGFEVRKVFGKFSNGIQNLSPNDPIMQAAMELTYAEDTPYHSLIGSKSGKTNNYDKISDGFVTYRSAHLPLAESEMIIKSGHAVHTQRAGIDEVKRILKEHYANLSKSDPSLEK